MSEDIRWRQRFQSFERGFLLLRSAFEERGLGELTQLEQEGIIQRFEYTFELAWKTLKDYLENAGVTLSQITPKAVIKAAFAAKLIDDGQAWIDMLAHRNLMSHTYDFAKFQEVVAALKDRYLAKIQELYLLLKEQMLKP
ncbi:MAG TPA: nucleotidyltransferase substrate binding protein [Chthoniobacteraceae bacterium]|nr:nucleotidyltransferase substrate binding protein [Chthoniobacteraceae bacterium]